MEAVLDGRRLTVASFALETSFGRKKKYTARIKKMPPAQINNSTRFKDKSIIRFLEEFPSIMERARLFAFRSGDIIPQNLPIRHEFQNKYIPPVRYSGCKVGVELTTKAFCETGG